MGFSAAGVLRCKGCKWLLNAYLPIRVTVGSEWEGSPVGGADASSEVVWVSAIAADFGEPCDGEPLMGSSMACGLCKIGVG